MLELEILAWPAQGLLQWLQWKNFALNFYSVLKAFFPISPQIKLNEHDTPNK